MFTLIPLLFFKGSVSMSSKGRNFPRKIKFTNNINPYAHGSVQVEFGNTKVYITASVEEMVPPFLKGKSQGWVTAEYSMLPGATNTRNQRERSKVGGRTQEIQRLIGRSLRSVIDLKKLGERTITVDCDVLVADGGTRTASISGGFIAISLAVKKLIEQKKITENPIKSSIGALSVGISKEGQILADLNYQEDSSCHTDMNVVMTDDGKFVEIQGTAEGNPFSESELQGLLSCAKEALQTVFAEQKRALS